MHQKICIHEKKNQKRCVYSKIKNNKVAFFGKKKSANFIFFERFLMFRSRNVIIYISQITVSPYNTIETNQNTAIKINLYAGTTDLASCAMVEIGIEADQGNQQVDCNEDHFDETEYCNSNVNEFFQGQSSSGANNVYFEDFDMSLKDSACSNQKMKGFELQEQRKKRKCKICQRIVDHDTYGMDDDFDGNEGDNDDENILDENTFEHGQSCNVEECTGYSVDKGNNGLDRASRFFRVSIACDNLFEKTSAYFALSMARRGSNITLKECVTVLKFINGPYGFPKNQLQSLKKKKSIDHPDVYKI
ncbi:hypothetical protein LXL04_023766 [Taraxacum kok-saghyz]